MGAVVTFWDISERKKSEAELIELKDHLENLVEQRTAELEDKLQKLNRNEKAMLYMVEDLNDLTSQLEKQKRKLQLTNQELEAFTYSVSHDLRAPLRAVDGFSKFLVEDYEDKLGKEGKRYIDVIRSNAVKMDKLILDLLNLSRISHSEMNMVPVDMGRVVESIYSEIADETEKIDFQLSIADLPKAVCDMALIKQIWQNLIGNALKYSSKSKIKKIEITGRFADEEVVFCIQDHGVGFDAKYADKLFIAFQRLHKEEDFPGTGIGLAIVKRIVERHGGRVWGEGKIGEGARFCFALPILEK